MRIGPIRLTQQRAMRALAGIVAAFLLSGHVLAAAGMCGTKGSVPQQIGITLAAAAEHPCAAHAADQLPPDSTTPKHHCPVEDPSAQPRPVDVPVPLLMSAPAPLWFADRVFDASVASPPAASCAAAPLPLYERLQRLRL